MSEQKKGFGRIIKGAVIFIAAALILQLAAVIFMTPAGLMRIYPYVLALISNSIDTTDKSLGEYYPLHGEAETADLIILACDIGVADTYTLAGDFLEFLTKFTKLSYVAVYLPQSKLQRLSSGITSGDSYAFSDACELYSSSASVSDQMINFAGEIFNLNNKLTPDCHMSLCGIRGYTGILEATSPLLSDLLVVPGGYNDTTVKLTSATDPEEYVSLFRENEDWLREKLGANFDRHSRICDAIAAGTIEESTAYDNLLIYTPEASGTVLAVLPRHLCTDDSPFMDKVRGVYENVSVYNVSYYDCETEYGRESIPVNDGNFPGFFDGIRIALAEDLAGFRKYYLSLIDKLDEELRENHARDIGEAGEKSFFIICGSGPITYAARNNPETETVSTGGESNAAS